MAETKKTKESKVVEIISREQLAKFLINFSAGGGIGIIKDENRYFVHTLDEAVELKPVFSDDYTSENFRREMETAALVLPYSERKSAEIKSPLTHP